jgi:hypothetical protein
VQSDLQRAGHLAFITDRDIDIANEIVREVLTIQCQQRRSRHAQAVAVAQFNSWLAAKQLGLQLCTHIIAVGDMAVMQQCKPIKVNFETETTACGAQLRAGNRIQDSGGYRIRVGTFLSVCSIISSFRYVAGEV